MALDVIRCAVGRGKACIVIIGLVIVVLGCYSHFTSAWLKIEYDVVDGVLTFKPYEGCNHPTIKPCPKISMERYFVAMSIITFGFSVCNLIASFITDMKNWRGYDIGYHFFAAILIIIAAIVYFVSAMQILELYDNELREEWKERGWHFRSIEKMVSAGLGLLNGLFYAATAYNIRVY